MNAISFQLLVHASLASAIPVIENSMRVSIMGPEAILPDFAVLTANNLNDLPSDFTICSSMASDAFLGSVSPFQLYQNGKPWISIWFIAAQKDSRHHQVYFYVSFKLYFYQLHQKLSCV